MKNFVLMVCVVSLAAFTGAAASQGTPKEVARVLSKPNLHGKTTTRYWGFKLYDAQLWTDGQGAFNRAEKFALTLRYAYAFSAEVLARSSVEEIARVEGASPAKFAKLETKLRKCLIDVDKGDRVTGVADGANRVTMFINGRKSCSMKYPRLRDRFFGIWLAPTSRDAKGAARLVGNF